MVGCIRGYILSAFRNVQNYFDFTIVKADQDFMVSRLKRLKVCGFECDYSTSGYSCVICIQAQLTAIGFDTGEMSEAAFIFFIPFYCYFDRF